jgi:hypothetical protein
MRRVAPGIALAWLVAAPLVRADTLLPPWMDDGDAPPPSWARSVAPSPDARQRPGDMVLFAGPSRAAARRGVTAAGATLPLFGARRGPGCGGPWWLVGPLAWTCSDGSFLAPEDPAAPERRPLADGLLREYFFVGSTGASAYTSLDSAGEGTPDRELEGGWGVAVVEQRTVSRERWARTSKGLWIATRELGAAHPSTFHGEVPGAGPFDLAWVLAERATVLPEPSAKARSKDARARFQVVHVLEERPPYVRVGDGAWMLARDLARPHVAPPPVEAGAPGERWIDVELATQTLVAYEDTRPVYATLVSTGRGPPGSESATPPGVHRIWVKILASDMDNVERDDIEAHYSLEDVPYVQFFDRAVALHGTYWHRDFGHVKSHGCVNLAPLDARWLFDFTGPRLPAGWVAAYPAPGAVDPGTVVRVR